VTDGGDRGKGWRRGSALAVIALLAALAARADDDAERIRRAVAHTVATQQPDGLFRYDFDFLTAAPSGEQNLVRQAGMLFALSAYLVDTGDRSVIAPIQTGLDALAQRSLPVGIGTAQSLLMRAGVFSIASWRLERALAGRGWLYAIEGDGRLVRGDKGGYASAEAGATALALLAELAFRRATGDDRFAEIRGGWLHGLLALRIPGAGVRNHPETLESSSYNDGEAWLALAAYHEAFPGDADAAPALAEIEEYALAYYRAHPDTSFFHWGAMASATRRERGDAARLADFAAQQAEWVLREVPPEKYPDLSSCALIEGLASGVAAIRAVPGREDLVARITDRVALELVRNRAFQVQPGQRNLALGGGGRLHAPALADSAGAFLIGRYHPYTRVDLTQHCIDAFLIARRYGLAGR
jgi:hypothetical protein